jgi:hypothetical protein
MDRDKIRKALDHFENDEYVDAKDIIKQEIAGKRDVFLKDKLGLKQNINPATSQDNNDGGIDGNEGDAGEEGEG